MVIGIKSSVWTEEFFNDFWFGLYVTSDVITNCEFAGEAWNIALSKRAPSLASMPYQDYLQTDHWKATSKAAKERASHRCQVCNKLDPHLHTHHRTYVRRGAEREDDLIVLCAKCHSLFHANGKLAK